MRPVLPAVDGWVVKLKNREISKIVNLSARKDIFDISWKVTSLCNYQCDFCIQGDQAAHRKEAEGESRTIRKAVCRKVLDLINDLKDYRMVKLRLIGGEVTILRDFPELIDVLAGSSFPGYIDFQITTNLSLPSDVFCEIIRNVSKNDTSKRPRRLHIAASYYAKYVTKEEFLAKIHEICSQTNLISNNNPQKGLLTYLNNRKRDQSNLPKHTYLSVGYPILSDSDYVDFLDMQRDLNTFGVSAAPIIIRQYHTKVSANILKQITQDENTPKTVEVTDSEGNTYLFRTMGDLGTALEEAECFNPTGMFCDAGINSIRIDAFGNVWRCPVIGSKMIMGNLLDGTFCRIDSPQICTADHCSCTQFSCIQRQPPAAEEQVVSPPRH